MTSTTVSSALKVTPTTKLITLGAGCFWGVERVFTKQFGGKGLVDVKVGYANGIPTIGNVNYEAVCLGNTNFVEAVQISYEPAQLTLKQILDIFFRMHDPITLNAQGPDRGTQYRSVILTHNDEDNELAWTLKKENNKVWYPNHHIVTVIEPIKIWHDAENYHQQYLEKNPGGYECPSHFIRDKPKA